MWVYLNDRFVQKEHAHVSVFDHGFLYGDGVYETLRVYGGRVLLWKRHLARLHRSCELIGLELPIADDAWLPIFGELLARNTLQNAGLRVTISRGEGELGIDPRLCARPTVVVMAKPLVEYTEPQREQGVTLHLASIRRNPELAQSPQIKAISFLNNILAKQEAARVGADDALMLNMDRELTECTASNIFFVKHQCLYTPAVECGILQGVTRDMVMELAVEQEISVEEGRYRIEDLFQADECFITNTGFEIMPVSKIGDCQIGLGKAGPLTSALLRAFKANMTQYLGPCLMSSNG
ncbi:MAG: aminotransferase class IV [Nitrospirota bacterium]|nr:aminotransferase class IV [Nitrospirota bacterium]MDH5774942.1 aminotransferase class IV [Nitrospirota bacterium]